MSTHVKKMEEHDEFDSLHEELRKKICAKDVCERNYLKDLKSAKLANLAIHNLNIAILEAQLQKKYILHHKLKDVYTDYRLTTYYEPIEETTFERKKKDMISRKILNETERKKFDVV